MVLAFACSWAAAAADLAGRRRRLRRRGPARHLAPPARGRPLTAADLRQQGAGQPHRDPAARGRARRLGRRRRPAAVGNHPLVGLDGHLLEPGRPPAAVLLAWVAVLAPDAGVRGGRAARLGRARPLADGAADPRRARPRAGGRAAAPAARRGARRAAELRLHRLAWAVHRPGADRPARSSASWSASPGQSPPRRWPTGCSCAATSPTRPTTGSAAASWCARRCRSRPCSPSPSRCSPSSRRPRAPGSTRRRWRLAGDVVRPPLPACRPSELHRPASPRPSCRPPPSATRAARGSMTTGPATTGAAW